MFKFILFFCLLLNFSSSLLYAQEGAIGILTVDEFSRRKGLIENKIGAFNLFLRSIDKSPEVLFFDKDSSLIEEKLFDFNFLPIHSNQIIE